MVSKLNLKEVDKNIKELFNMVSKLREAKNNSEKEFKVNIIETLEKRVKVMAKDEYEALTKVRHQWNDEEIILYPEDVTDVDFQIVGSNRNESLKEGYDSARPNMEIILDALDNYFYSESTVLDALLRGLDDNMLGYILEDLINEYKESREEY